MSVQSFNMPSYALSYGTSVVVDLIKSSVKFLPPGQLSLDHNMLFDALKGEVFGGNIAYEGFNWKESPLSSVLCPVGAYPGHFEA